MNIDKSRLPKPKSQPAFEDFGGDKPSAVAIQPPRVPTLLPPLFRRIDWLAFGLTTLLVFIGYLLTLAPDLTLEDSGELAVGSFYAGVPHPPGYPVWTIYTWLFTVLLPISNIAFRVAVSSAVAASAACGLLALMVSRGSSMMVEGITEFRGIDRRWENAMCVVSGFVAGCLLAFNGFYWSQAIIVEVYCFGVLSLMGVLCCLLRWLYAPNQHRYLYLASFLFGVCFTNHQTLLVAAMGIEVAILAVQPRLGRDLFAFNSLVYLLVMIFKHQGYVGVFDNNLPLYIIFNIIGTGSIYTAFWYALKLDSFSKLKLVLIHLGGNILIWSLYLHSYPKSALDDKTHTLLIVIFNSIGIGLLFFYYWLSGKTETLFTEWKPLLLIVGAWMIGAGFYFYMPLTSMTNPPMNWGYARTYDGFIHALTRGQYEKTNPIATVPRLLGSLQVYGKGAIEEFNIVYLLIGLVPFFSFGRLQKREKSWIVGLTAIFLCLGLLLLILLNPSTDKQSGDLNKVFFTASYAFIAMLVGYGLTIIGSFIATEYDKCRLLLQCGSVCAAVIAAYSLRMTLKEVSYPLMVYAAVFGVGLAALAVFLFFTRAKAPLYGLLAAYALMPIHPIISHWTDNEQHGHLFGYWFGHDMFTPPDFGKPGQFYPEMDRNAVLFGGTDPGRFCPTYMIFCESFIPPSKKPLDPKFDRRDVYLITQNALADGTYLNYIRAHYNRSTQIDPPFFQELLRSKKEIEAGVTTNLLARAFGPVDRFFTNLGKRIEDRRRKEGVYPPTEIHTPSVEESRKCFDVYIADAQRRLAVGQLEPGEDVRVIENRVQIAGQVSVMQINGLLTKVIFDANPTNEFYVEESFPLKWMYPYLTPFGIIMKINRKPLPEITEDIVKKDHEFWSLYSSRLTGNWVTYDTSIKDICDFVERTYRRMDFRNYKGDPKFVRDNDAQKAFSKLRSAQAGLYAWRVNASAVGTPAYQLMHKEAEFAYKQAFCFCPYSPEVVFRLVSLLANVQRIDDSLMIAETSLKFDPENTGIKNLVAELKLIKQGQPGTNQNQVQLSQLEQRYATNPGDIQAGFNLAAVYLQNQRTGQAMQVLDTIISVLEPQFRADPGNAQLAFQLAQAYGQRQKNAEATNVMEQLINRLEPVYRTNAANVSLAFNLAQAYMQCQKNPLAIEILDRIIALPGADATILLNAAQLYAQTGQAAKLEVCLIKVVNLLPENPEGWYDLAALQALQSKNQEAMTSLTKAVELSNRRIETTKGAKDLAALAVQDGRFQALRTLPEYKKLMKSK